jgi:hypothetical protein
MNNPFAASAFRPSTPSAAPMGYCASAFATLPPAVAQTLQSALQNLAGAYRASVAYLAQATQGLVALSSFETTPVYQRWQHANALCNVLAGVLANQYSANRAAIICFNQTMALFPDPWVSEVLGSATAVFVSPSTPPPQLGAAHPVLVNPRGFVPR